MNTRNYSAIDRFLFNIDTGLRTLLGVRHTTGRPNPAAAVTENTQLSTSERDMVGRLMRINHAGEVAAQGLYQGQALSAALPQVRTQMEQAAKEENDHLEWCRIRIQEMGTHTSYLDPLWYVGAVTIGVIAGKAGDQWSLGFVAETERQVVKHLQEHLAKLPDKDKKTRAIIEQMKVDEGQHATAATRSGGRELPFPIKQTMRLMSKVMTKTTYWL